MNDSINLKQRTTNKYFSMVFSKKYKEWSEKTKGNQQDFADACEVQNKNSISNWSTGKQIPKDKTFRKVLSVFNEEGIPTTVEDFIPHTKDEKYEFAPDYVKNIQDQNLKLSKEIGLSEGFLDFIFNNTGFDDPNEGYPVWSPLQYVDVPLFKTNDKALKYLEMEGVFLNPVRDYIRLPLKKTRAVSEDKMFTINTGDGTSVLLSEIDLYILKDLQDKVVEMVKFLYFMRRKDMQIQRINAVKQSNPIYRDNVLNHTDIALRPLSKDDLIAIDPYMQYLKSND